MSKRMTDTEIWSKAWYRKLPLEYKLFWRYILDRCDIAGFWDIDFELASFSIGRKINHERAAAYFANQIYPVNSKYWLIVDFIQFQNGWPLNEKSPVHKKIIDLLNLKGIDIRDNTLYDRVHDRVCNTLQVRVIVEVDKGGMGGKLPKKKQPPICETDLTDELMERSPEVYRIGKMLIDSCQNVMSMKHPISLVQLEDLVQKYGAVRVNNILKYMENKGLKYLNSKGEYTYITAETWMRNDIKREK